MAQRPLWQAPQKILVSRTDALGDTLLTLPLLRALRAIFPHSRIDFLVSAYTAPLYQNHPWFDTLCSVPRAARVRDFQALLRAQTPDWLLSVFPDRFLAWAAWRQRVPSRMGTSRRWWSLLYNRPLRHSRRRGDRHEADCNLDFARFFKAQTEITPPQLFLTQTEQEAACLTLRQLGMTPEKRWVFLHPGSRGSSANLALAAYCDLARALSADPQLEILLTFGPGESALQSACREALGQRVRYLEPQPLRQFMAILGQASLFLSGNTGPMHIAAALQRKTLSFFPSAGPTGPGRWAPLGDRAAIMTAAVKTTGGSLALELGLPEILSKARSMLND